jgi:folliculin
LSFHLGPSPIFVTQTVKDLQIDDLEFEIDNSKKSCPACNSIGPRVAYTSKDPDCNATYVSSQLPAISETLTMVKQAAVRSLSCEVSPNKDGGFVFFGDAHRGHVLSHTFQIKDSEARGFYKLFSIIILMKDNMFLLNIKPFLSDKLTMISNELQKYAQKIYDEEQLKTNQRAQRLSNGYNGNQNQPRSLVTLTGERNIFGYLHAHFSWLLSTGAKCLTETFSDGSSLPWLSRDFQEISLGQSTSNMNEETDEDSRYSMRRWRNILKNDFIAICYCALTGVQIVVRGPPDKTCHLVSNLKKILPEALHKFTKINAEKYVIAKECRILSLPIDVAVPQMTANIFRVDLMEDHEYELIPSVKWIGDVPSKWPILLAKILKAVDEESFTDDVLDKHLKVLVEEWKKLVYN